MWTVLVLGTLSRAELPYPPLPSGGGGDKRLSTDYWAAASFNDLLLPTVTYVVNPLAIGVIS